MEYTKVRATRKEWAEILGMSYNTMRKWSERGLIAVPNSKPIQHTAQAIKVYIDQLDFTNSKTDVIAYRTRLGDFVKAQEALEDVEDVPDAKSEPAGRVRNIAYRIYGHNFEGGDLHLEKLNLRELREAVAVQRDQGIVNKHYYDSEKFRDKILDVFGGCIEAQLEELVSVLETQFGPDFIDQMLLGMRSEQAYREGVSRLNTVIRQANTLRSEAVEAVRKEFG